MKGGGTHCDLFATHEARGVCRARRERRAADVQRPRQRGRARGNEEDEPEDERFEHHDHRTDTGFEGWLLKLVMESGDRVKSVLVGVRSTRLTRPFYTPHPINFDVLTPPWMYGASMRLLGSSSPSDSVELFTAAISPRRSHRKDSPLVLRPVVQRLALNLR